MNTMEYANPYVLDLAKKGTGRMRVEFINPFVKAAYDVLLAEVKSEIKKGELSIQSSAFTAEEVTVMIGVVGQVQGVVLYGMSERTAKNIVSAMTGQTVPIFDRIVESAIAELGNVITGRASAELEKAGFSCRVTPPMVIVGRGAIISTVSIQRLVIPVEISSGSIEISVALRETG